MNLWESLQDCKETAPELLKEYDAMYDVIDAALELCARWAVHRDSPYFPLNPTTLGEVSLFDPQWREGARLSLVEALEAFKDL